MENNFPNLPSKIRVGGIELTKRSANEYDVLDKDSKKVGRIRMNVQIAQVDCDTKGYIIPFDIKIVEVGTVAYSLPFDSIKKVIMATLIMGIS